MTVYRLDLAYDGAGFRGYARQQGQRTVQGELEQALATVMKATVVTAVAGRTDAGVHARHQVVSFEHDADLDLERLRRAVNGLIGPEVAVFSASVEPEGFNARFSAAWRRYRYRVDIRPTADPVQRHTVWHAGRRLDLGAMTDTASSLVGVHDFSSFCRSIEGGSNVRRVSEILIEDHEGVVDVWVTANSFCHQMVRSLVGYLYDVGRGFSDAARVAEVISARDRSMVATVAPAHGLTLWEVGY